MNSIIVQKYGGTSVGSPERIKAVAERIKKTKKSIKNVVVVVSAMGDTTDDLITLAKQVSKKPHPREYDALISTGENISAALVAMALHDMGVDAVSLNGAQAGITTESFHNKAKIINVDTRRMQRELKAGRVVIVTGFQGINDNNDVVTIGRGGSDTSAVVIAAALKAPECEIYTDVDGVYTTDPRIIKNASKLDEITYDEMLELASLGAKVLHPRSVECAKENSIILHVRSSFNSNQGTRVKEAYNMEVNRTVTGVTVNEDEAKISILNVPDHPGVAGTLFMRLAKENINVDMIIQSTERNKKNNITFTVGADELDAAIKTTKAVAKEIKAEGVEHEKAIAKISIVGVGMISKPGVAAQLFHALGEAKINIKLISTSEIKISCAIDKKEAKRALALLHKEFGLDKV